MCYKAFNFEEFYIRNYKLIKWDLLMDFLSLTVAVIPSPVFVKWVNPVGLIDSLLGLREAGVFG